MPQPLPTRRSPRPSWRTAARAVLVGLSALVTVLPARAHEVNDVPSKVQLIDELRGMNSTLRQAQAQLDTSLAVDAIEVVKVLNDAQVAWLAEDHPRAALLLLRLIARPAFKDHPAWPEALEYLGESLYALGLREAARTYMQQAVEHPRQLPTPWRRRYARLLAIAGDRLTLPQLRTLWRRYQEGQEDDDAPSAADNAIRYQYAKALVRHDAHAEADEQLAQVPEGDPWYLQALYFRGIIQLKQAQEVKAKEAFEEALAAWQRSTPAEPRPWLEDIGDSGPAREIITLPQPDEDALPSEEAARHTRMGAVIHLALARLAAAHNNDATAWQHYRQIPRGDPDFAAALAEGSFILFRRAQYAWCIRVVDQLLAGRGDDVSAAQLTLWKAQLQARAADYGESLTTYALLEATLSETRVDAEPEARRLFSEAVLAWTDPDESVRARALEADIISQEEALKEAQETAELLATLIRSDALLPTVARGREILEVLDARMAHFAQHLELAGRVAHVEEDPALHGGGPPATRADLRTIAESHETLKARLDVFEDQLTTFESSYRKRIASVLQSEVPVVAALEKDLNAEVARARTLRADLAANAQENVEQYAAEARFGQVDIAWWRKEEMTEKVKAAYAEQKALLDLIDDAENPPPPPPPRPQPLPDDPDAEDPEGRDRDEEQPEDAPAAAEDYEEAAAPAPRPGAVARR